ncbi:MAG: hypothetical protein KJ767_01115 [Nanoarchaeota archaeon]|nr:hypothetical protein [Nanoarchaeota archaeon]
MAKTLDELLNGIDEAKEKERVLSEQRVKDFKEAQERIKKGESTGNIITDFSINYSCIGADYKKISENLNKLNKKLEENAGREVLFDLSKTEKKIEQGFSRPIVSTEREVKSESHIYRLGIIQEPGLLFDFTIDHIKDISSSALDTYSMLPRECSKSAVMINVKNQIVSTDLKEWNKIKGGISVPLDLFVVSELNLEPIHKLSRFFLIGPTFETNLYIGDEVHDRIISYIDSLKVERVGFREFFTPNKKEIIFGYVKGLEMIGSKIPETLRKEYNQILEKKQERENQQLDARKRNLISRLEGAVLNSKTSNIANKMDEEGIIKKTLKEAISMGLYNDDSVIKSESGLKVNVREYVRELCEKYRIEIPVEKAS